MSGLLIDVGNSRVAAARARPADASLPFERLYAVDTPVEAAERKAVAAALAALYRGGETVAVASVVPAVTDAVVAALPQTRSVDHTWTFPFTHDVREPETVGADRWCNLAAAATAGLVDAIVVDAGTATTFDILEGGRFRGGLIAPGMAFAARRLQERAACLWPVPFASCGLRPGRDTEEALAIGAFHVGVNGILGTLAALQELYPTATVVVTGGLAEFLVRPGFVHDPDWTLRGLAALAEV